MAFNILRTQSHKFFNKIQRLSSNNGNPATNLDAACLQQTKQWKLTPTFLFHSCPKAFFQATVTALIPLVLIHDTVSTEATSVHVVFADTASEESLAAIAACSPIMFSCRSVSADGTELTESRGARGGNCRHL